MKKLKVIYVFDPICGWCYGFGSEMKKLQDEFQDKLEFEIISGGMRLGDRVGPVEKVAPYLKDVYKVIQERTEAKFGDAFVDNLHEGTMVLSSMPPAKALTAFKHFKPENALHMAHEIQKSIYIDGRHPVDETQYEELAEKFDIPVDSFKKRFASEETTTETIQQFKTSADFGVQGFPAVFLGTETEIMPIARGYLPYEELRANAVKAAAYYGLELELQNN